MLPADDKARAIELLQHAVYLLNPHPALSREQLLQEIERSRITIQHALAAINKT